MKQIPETEMIAEALRHMKGNRTEIEESKHAECASCCSPFDAKLVSTWKDEWVSPETRNRIKRWTALCPRCGEPTVIGSASGLLRDQAYAAILHHFMLKANAIRATVPND